MRLLLLLIILLTSPAWAEQQLVNRPDGKQELLDVGKTGGYDDPARVVWDTRTDGALPKNAPVGFARRVVDRTTGKASLEADFAERDKKEAADLAERERKATRAAAYEALLQKLKNKTITADEVPELLRLERGL